MHSLLLPNWEEKKNEDFKDIQYWRDELFVKIMMALLPVGIIIYFPNIIASLKIGIMLIVIIDTFVLLLMFLIIFGKFINLKQKKRLFIFGMYLLSAMLLYFLGSNGPGLIYLLSTSIFIITVYNNKLAYYSIGFNALLSALPIISLKTGHYISYFFQDYGLTALIAFSSNLIMLNVVVVIALAILINGLQRTLLKEKSLSGELSEEKANLVEAMKKAEESDKLKTAFLANISHEIRTPMNGIIGFCDLLNDPYYTDEEKQEYAGLIKQSSNRLTKTINDLVDISQIEAGVMDVKLAETDVQSILFELYSQYMEYAKYKDIQLDFENKDNKQLSLKTDEFMILQIFSNIINNAIKYTDSGKVNFGYNINNKYFEFYCTDTGIGIDKEYHEKIFERFYKVNNELNSEYEGSGLGLSLSKSYARQLNGDVYVFSQIGLGSKFTCKIPLKW
jgi:signal transduction histidine kinase